MAFAGSFSLMGVIDGFASKGWALIARFKWNKEALPGNELYGVGQAIGIVPAAEAPFAGHTMAGRWFHRRSPRARRPFFMYRSIMQTCFVTIVSANYLAYARVLADSLAEFEPAELRVLIVDRPTPEVCAAVAQSRLACIYAQDLGLENFERLAYKYDILELNTALKPSLLKRVFAEGFEQAIYLDPDIQLHAPLLPVMQALGQAEIVLTPHALQPVMDGLRPSDIDFLRAGAYNLGFVALRKGTDSLALLDWWESRCLGLGFIDPAFGTFVDQKWMDLAPAYFASVGILRNPGCNVAYWNLHERALQSKGAQVLVDGHPLCFFHFSGVKAEAPGQLSKYQTRHTLEPGSVLQRLVADYCRALLAAGHAERSKLRYSFGALDDGTAITPTMRRALLASAIDEQDPFNSASPLQKQLKAAGITPSAAGTPVAAIDTRNFDQSSRTVVMANHLVRLLARVMGVPRLMQLARYGALLARESHLASVLLKRPLDLRHRLRR
jgi:predicted transcriptional regulator